MSEGSKADPAGPRVEFKVALKGRALARKATAVAPSTEAPPAEEVPRVARLLALAHRSQRLIDEGRVKDQAEIARLIGLSRARVTQIMKLRWLAPVLQEVILFADDGSPRQAPLMERQIRRLASRDQWADQAAA